MIEMDRARARRFLVAALGAFCAHGAWGCSSRDDPKSQRPVAWFPRGTTAALGRVNCTPRMPGIVSTRLALRFAEPPGAVVEVPVFFVAVEGQHEHSTR